jgi:hypothetical protein
MRPPHAGHREQHPLPPTDQPESCRDENDPEEADQPCPEEQVPQRVVWHGNVSWTA